MVLQLTRCRDVNDDVAASGSSVAHNLVDPLCAAAGATALKNCDNLNLNETNADQEKIVDKEIRGPCNNDNVDIDAEDQDYHNAATMRFKSKKRGSNNTDLDSIEHLSDDESGKKCLEDEMDSVREDEIIDEKSSINSLPKNWCTFKVSMHRMKSERVESRRRRKAIKDENKKMQKKLKEKKKDEKSGDKVVDCLYYSLMCADFPCTIMWIFFIQESLSFVISSILSTNLIQAELYIY